MVKRATSLKVISTEAYFSMVRRQLSEEGWANVRVTGNSMRPLLRHLRDAVTIVPPDEIHRGDIVLFDRKNGRYALHRVIRTGKHGFDMAGDNQWHVEKDLPYEQIVGVVCAIVRGGKYVSCEKVFLKIYKMAVTSLTLPRIYIWKAFVQLMRPLRKRWKRRKGAAL